MNYLSEGHNHVSPYLQTKDAKSIMNFLKVVFEGEELTILQSDDNRIMHAEVKIKDTVIMLGEPAKEPTTGPSMIHIYVKDVDTTFDQAVAYGCEIIVEPDETPDGERRAGVIGPQKNQWWFATRLE